MSDELENIIKKAEGLLKDTKDMIDLLLEHVDDSISKKKSPLIRIGVDGRTLGWKFNNLGIDIIKEHERRQLEEK